MMELRVEIQPGMHDPVTWAMQVECNSACSFVQSKAPGLIRLWIICDVRWCLRARTMSSMGTLPWRWNAVAALFHVLVRRGVPPHVILALFRFYACSSSHVL